MKMKQNKKDESNSIVATIMQAIDQLPENNKANEAKHLIEMYLDLLSINNRRLLWQQLSGEQYNFLDDNKFFTSFSARSNINQLLVRDNKNLPKFSDNVLGNELMITTLEMIRTRNVDLLDPSQVFVFLSVIAPALNEEQKIYLKTLLKKDQAFAFLFSKKSGFSFSSESDLDTNVKNPLQNLDEALVTPRYIAERAVSQDTLMIELLNILEEQYLNKQRNENEYIINVNILLALIQDEPLREIYRKDIFRTILFSSPTSIQQRFQKNDPLLGTCQLSEIPHDENCQKFLEIYLKRYNLEETMKYPWPLIDLLLSDQVNLQTPWQKMWEGYHGIGTNHYCDNHAFDNLAKNKYKSEIETRTLEHVFFELLLRVKVEPSLAKTLLERCLTLCDNKKFVLTKSLFIVGSAMDTKRYENRAIPEISSPLTFICKNFGGFYQLFGNDIKQLMEKMVDLGALENSNSFYTLCSYAPKNQEEYLLRDEIILYWINNKKMDAVGFDQYGRGPLSALCNDLNNTALILQIINNTDGEIDKNYISKLLCTFCSKIRTLEKPTDDMIELIKVLLHKGANPLISNEYTTALKEIVLTNNPTFIPILKLFLEKNTENVNRKQPNGKTLLFNFLETEFCGFLADKSVHADFVKLLLENGENPLIGADNLHRTTCFELMGKIHSNKGVNKGLAGMMIFFDRGYGQSLTPEIATDVLKEFLNHFMNNNNALYYQNNKNKLDSIFQICLERGANTDELLKSHPGTPFQKHFIPHRVSLLKKGFFNIENTNQDVEPKIQPKIPLTINEQFEEIQNWIEKQEECINKDSELYNQLMELRKNFDEFERIYQCPLRLDIMNNPVTVSSGISYEASSIVGLSNLSKEKMEILCPKSNKPLARNEKREIIIFENVSLKQAIPEALKNLKMQKESLENLIEKQEVNLNIDI